MSKAKEELKKIKDSMINGLLDYLHTGVFPNNSPNAYMTAYSAVHRLADEPNESSVQLFEFYRDTIMDYLNYSQDIIRKSNDDQFIDTFLQENEKCNILIYWMRRIFTYLDKFYMKERSEGSLSTYGLFLYKTYVFEPLKDKLFASVNKLIQDDRDCNVVYRFNIKNVLQITDEVDMQVPEIKKENERIQWVGKSNSVSLKLWFDNYFSKETRRYIADKAKTEINNMSPLEYIDSALKYFDEENQRKNEYIHENFRKQLDDINYEYMIEKNALSLAKGTTGIGYMLKNKKDNELKRAYMLISKHLPSIKYMTDELDPYIRARGDELSQNKDLIKDPIKFIPKLIELKKEMDSLITFAFENFIICQDAKNKAFSHFMNKEIYSKQLANYVDYLMKIGFKGQNDQQMEDMINDVINLFKCLSNKLIFQSEACRRLSDRLIANKSISLQSEKNLIHKLKAEAGVTYVNKMTAMISDLDNGKKIVDDYRMSWITKGQPNGIVFQTQVVQQGSWDIHKTKFDKIEIPHSLQYCIDDFCKFYYSKHKEHKLSWCFGLGTLEVKYLYLNKSYISVSTLTQFAMLWLLEKNGEQTIDELLGRLGHNSIDILLNEASGLLFNPSFNKSKRNDIGIISTNMTKDQELSKETRISLNKAFISNNLKFQTFPLIQKKIGSELQQQEQLEATALRNYQNMLIDATVTRIMKSRIGKKNTHMWLITEVVKQIDLFQVQPPQIKERIEALIEKQIIKRSQSDRNCYDYLA